MIVNYWYETRFANQSVLIFSFSCASRYSSFFGLAQFQHFKRTWWEHISKDYRQPTSPGSRNCHPPSPSLNTGFIQTDWSISSQRLQPDASQVLDFLSVTTLQVESLAFYTDSTLQCFVQVILYICCTIPFYFNIKCAALIICVSFRYASFTTKTHASRDPR